MNEFNYSPSNSPKFESPEFDDYQVEVQTLEDESLQFHHHQSQGLGIATNVNIPHSYQPFQDISHLGSIPNLQPQYQSTPQPYQYPNYDIPIDYYSNFHSSISSSVDRDNRDHIDHIDHIDHNIENLDHINPIRSIDPNPIKSMDQNPIELIETIKPGVEPLIFNNDYFKSETVSISNSVPNSPGKEDNELKRIALENINTPIPQMIIQFVTKKKGNSKDMITFKDYNLRDSEKQILGLIWLLNNCESNVTSVTPRNKLYSLYAKNCTNWDLFPLTPAHFGKLVRVLFPNLTIRRLGVKGQARYHFCGIKLRNEHSQDDYSNPISIDNKVIHWGNHELINLKYIPSLLPKIYESNKNITKLKLPSIFPYISSETDYDLAETLYYLYIVKGSRMIQSVRHLRIDEVFDSLNNFHAILTTQIVKIYVNNDLSDWIMSCDLIIYYQMIKIISNTLQTPMNPHVIDTLKELGSLSGQLNQYLNKLSEQFISFKVNVANIFIGVFNKLMKVLEFNNTPFKPNSELIQSLRSVDFKTIVLRLPISVNHCISLLQLLVQLPDQLSSYKFEKFIKYLDQWVLPKVNPRLVLVIVRTIVSAIWREMVGSSFMEWVKIGDFMEAYIGFILEGGGLSEFDNQGNIPLIELIPRPNDLLKLGK